MQTTDDFCLFWKLKKEFLFLAQEPLVKEQVTFLFCFKMQAAKERTA